MTTVFKCERLWSLDELAEKLGVKRSWIYYKSFRRELPYKKIAGKLRFDPVEIDAWIESQPGCSLKTRVAQRISRI